MHECIIAREYHCVVNGVVLCLDYVRMLVTPNLSFESESYEPHVIVRARTRLLKVEY